MVKKIQDKQGNIYVLKKPFYKRWWFIGLIVLIVISYLGSNSNSNKENKEAKTASSSQTSNSSSVTNKNSVSSSASSSKKTETGTTSVAETSQSTAFVPQDVSDKTIESIKTYGDYLTMFKKIIEDYYARYETAVVGTALYDTTTFEQMKQQYDAEFAKQEKEYGTMKDVSIIGKESIIEFLKGYRDNLQNYIDTVTATLNSIPAAAP